jgi:hypothetical protein
MKAPPPTYKSPPMPTPPTTFIAPESVEVELVEVVTTMLTAVSVLREVLPLSIFQPCPVHIQVLVPTVYTVPVLGLLGKPKVAMF